MEIGYEMKKGYLNLQYFHATHDFGTKMVAPFVNTSKKSN
jgi:hypothetical protein